MSNRNWIAAIVIGLILIVACGSGWGIWALTKYKNQHAEQRQEAAKANAPASQQYFHCLGERALEWLPKALLVCGLEEKSAADDASYTRYDLEAQQDMAKWAFALLLVSIAGTLLSFLGLAALLYSLNLNREATNAAVASAELAREQRRAWVSVRLKIRQRPRIVEGDFLIVVDVICKCRGTIPAKNFHIIKETSTTPMHHIGEQNSFSPIVKKAHSILSFGKTLVPDEEEIETQTITFPITGGTIEPRIFIVGRYARIEPKYLIVAECYQLRRIGNPSGGFDPSNGLKGMRFELTRKPSGFET